MTAIREQILDAFATRMGATRAPYAEDYGGSTITALIEADEEVLSEEYNSVTLLMSVRVEKIDEFGVTSRATFANNLLMTIIKTATGTDRTLGGLCSDIGYQGGGTVYPESGSELVGAFANFNIRYAFDVGDPETNSYSV